MEAKNMKKPSVSKSRQVLGILLSLLIILCGVCLMAACLSIYHSGDQPFTRESVAAAFAPISWPIYICLIAIAAAFLLELLKPVDRKTAPRRQTAMILRRMQEKTDLSLCPDELRSGILAQRSIRRKRTRTGLILLVLCSVIFLSYGANPHNFHQTQINDSMIRAMYVLLPCCLVPFGYGIFAAYRDLTSMEAEIELLNPPPKESKAAAAVPASGKNARLLRNVLLGIAVVILVYGFFTGGTADVLTKAVNICTECVGLG